MFRNLTCNDTQLQDRWLGCKCCQHVCCQHVQLKHALRLPGNVLSRMPWVCVLGVCQYICADACRTLPLIGLGLTRLLTRTGPQAMSAAWQVILGCKGVGTVGCLGGCVRLHRHSAYSCCSCLCPNMRRGVLSTLPWFPE